MSNISTLFLFLVTTFCYAQINQEQFIGHWVKVSGRMKDGSAIIIPAHKDSNYQEITIDRSNIGRSSNSVLRVKPNLTYTLEGNFLKTSVSSGYVIKQIAKDTISICEKFEGVSDDKLTCFTLVRESKRLAKNLESVHGTVNLIASENLTPRLKSDFNPAIFNELMGKLFNYRVAGNIVLDLKSKTILAQPVDPKTDDKTWKVIKRHIENSYNKFELENFGEFETITIQFIYETIRKGIYHGVDIKYHTHDLTVFDIPAEGPVMKIIDNSNHAQKAAEAFAAGKFVKAADLFSKAHENDPYDLDHLYNKAASLYQAGDKDGACNVWKQLNDLEQVNGKKMFETHCK